MQLTFTGHGPNARTLSVPVAVVLAPMAGVTNPPFRRLCREYGGGLFTSEMVGARSLLETWARLDKDKSISEGKERVLLRASFDPDEPVRSLQLYGTDPSSMHDAVARLVADGHVDHIDLNMGCPAIKVTRHGGGAALPWKLDHAIAIIDAAVRGADGVPVTVKSRLGIDDDHLYAYDLAVGAAQVGAAGFTLHARTAEQAYSGHAYWQAIGELVRDVPTIPILGNGDIFSGYDAREMAAQTGCAGVVVGRGCLGRPWLFRDIEAALNHQSIPAPPTLGDVCTMIIRHTELLVEYLGMRSGCLEIRKHTGWYLQGFPVGGQLRKRLHHVEHIDEVRAALADLPADLPMPPEAAHMKRGHTHGPKPVRLPQGWMDSRQMDGELAPEADIVLSGG
ncbi:tRNA dihydrouridine synthase DusB [Stomatohabitans albus]|uniref:tRNA dihydrouridine synthase DusB n=1 Tax=Stomatohabitans albus TaxID=3110766 RepID=UPI00300CCB6A